MTTARADILQRIRDALGPDATDGRAGEVEPSYRRRGAYEPGAAPLVDRFEDRTLDYRAGFLRATAESLPERVAEAVAAGVARSEDAHPGTRPRVLVPPGLNLAWVGRVEGEIVVDDAAQDTGALDSGRLDTVALTPWMPW